MENKNIKSIMSSRPVVGLIFTIFIAFFLYLQHHAGTIDIRRRSMFLACELFVIFPLIVWSIYEIFRMNERRREHFFSTLLSALLAAAPLIYYVAEMYLTQNEVNGYKYFSLLLLSLLAIYLFGTLLEGRSNILDSESYLRRFSFRRLLMMAVLFWNLFLYMCFTRGNIPALALILLSTIAADTFGFIVGKTIGRLRVFPSSPAKTLEGFLVPLILVPLTLFLLLYYFGRSQIDTPMKVYLLFPSLFFLTLSSSFGDLFFSEQKRFFGLKDYGGMMGSHGGFWDRFDSHSFGLLVGVPLYLFLFR